MSDSSSEQTHHREEHPVSGEEYVGENPSSPSPAPSVSRGAQGADAGNEICLVIVTPKRDDFDRVHSWAETIEEVS